LHHRFVISVLVGCLSFQIGSADRLSAHEKPHKKESSKHMEAMRAVQRKIPQEYRDMDRPPFPATPASLERGGELFLARCALCHGEEGRGDGRAGRGMEPRPANFHDVAHSDMYGPGEKFWIITHGALVTGMPAFGGILSDDERWNLVQHILSLQGRIGVPRQDPEAQD
jgi:mono/diheme cytochrome c family protein